MEQDEAKIKFTPMVFGMRFAAHPEPVIGRILNPALSVDRDAL